MNAGQTGCTQEELLSDMKTPSEGICVAPTDNTTNLEGMKMVRAGQMAHQVKVLAVNLVT